MSDDLIDQFFVNSGILAFRYFFLCGLFFIVFYFLFATRLRKHKLQSSSPAISDHKRDIFYSIYSTLIFAAIFTLTITVFLPYTQLYNTVETYGRRYYWLSFVLMILIHDTYFYWTHRLIHLPALFKRIHLVHHKSTNPSPWTSLAFHPAEAVIQALVMPVMAILIPIQHSAFLIYFLFQFFHNIYGHLGFELLPRFIRESRMGRQLNTSVLHNSHHKNVRGNYGLFFTFWDTLMGTTRSEVACGSNKLVTSSCQAERSRSPRSDIQIG